MARDRMRLPRRHFLRGGLALAGLGLLTGCGVGQPWGQPAATVRRIGFLLATTPAAERARIAGRPFASFVEAVAAEVRRGPGLSARSTLDGEHLIARVAAWTPG